jgi:hypothetical protein
LIYLPPDIDLVIDRRRSVRWMPKQRTEEIFDPEILASQGVQHTAALGSVGAIGHPRSSRPFLVATHLSTQQRTEEIFDPEILASQGVQYTAALGQEIIN